MNFQAELITLLLISIIGQSSFAVFEVETPPWRKMLKWGIIVVLTLGAHALIGHAAIAIPLALGVLGATVHFRWCRAQGIDPVHATPRRRYYELRGWRWVE